MMDIEEFIERLYKAGWTNPNDAQWENIGQLWYELAQEGIKIYLPYKKP